MLIRQEQAAVDDPVQKGARGEVAGFDELSLFGPERFRAVLDGLAQRYPRAELVQLRLSAVEATGTMRTPDFNTHSFTVRLDLKVQETSESEGVQEGLRPAQVPAGAPARIIRTVNARTDTQPADVEYMTLSPASTAAPWTLHLSRGPDRPDRRDFVASLSGETVRGQWEPTPPATP